MKEPWNPRGQWSDADLMRMHRHNCARLAEVGRELSDLATRQAGVEAEIARRVEIARRADMATVA